MSVNRGSPQPPCRLEIFQLNMQHSGVCRDLVVSFLRHHPCDVLLLQDTVDSLRSRFGGLPGYSLFLPSGRGGADVPSGPPLVGVLVKSSLRARPIAFSNPRMCGVFLSTPLGLVACVSAYIHYQRGLGLEALSAMVYAVKAETPFILIARMPTATGPGGALLMALGMLWVCWWRIAFCSIIWWWRTLGLPRLLLFLRQPARLGLM